MLTVKEKQGNPLIRVYPSTRKKLKLLAAHYEESMLEVVERLASAELERLRKGETPDVSGETGEHWQERPPR